MSEQEWLTSRDPAKMLRWLDRPQGDRKLLLSAVACLRANWHLLILESSRKAVEWTELYADGLVERDEEYHRLEWRSEGAAYYLEMQAEPDAIERWSAEAESHGQPRLNRLTGLIDVRETAPDLRQHIDAAYMANQLMTHDPDVLLERVIRSPVQLLSPALLRDIFANPFRPVGFDSAWRTSTAVAMAKGMYDSRDFTAMPILADALQDAGCDDDDVLSHCRAEHGIHVRGCWVIDLVLGNS